MLPMLRAMYLAATPRFAGTSTPLPSLYTSLGGMTLRRLSASGYVACRRSLLDCISVRAHCTVVGLVCSPADGPSLVCLVRIWQVLLFLVLRVCRSGSTLASSTASAAKSDSAKLALLEAVGPLLRALRGCLEAAGPDATSVLVPVGTGGGVTASAAAVAGAGSGALPGHLASLDAAGCSGVASSVDDTPFLTTTDPTVSAALKFFVVRAVSV